MPLAEIRAPKKPISNFFRKIRNKIRLKRPPAAFFCATNEQQNSKVSIQCQIPIPESAQKSPTFFSAFVPAVKGWPKSLKQLAIDLKTTLKTHPYQFFSAIGAYFGAALAIKLTLQEVDAVKWASEKLNFELPLLLSWAKLSLTSVIVGELKAFVADFYSQVGRVVKGSVEHLGNKERFYRATAVSLVIGAFVSGILTDNWLAINSQLGNFLGLSLPLRMSLLFGFLQTAITMPYFFAFNKVANWSEKKVFKKDSLEEKQKMKDEFWPTFWKAYLAATPANLLIAVAVPIFPPEVSFVITMTVSFGVFLIRALSTGK